MDKIEIKFDDGCIYDGWTLPDISYEKFCELMPWNGSSNIAYENYLRDNKMKYLTDFNKDGIKDLTLIVSNEWRERTITFKSTSDSDKEENDTVEHQP